MGLAIILSSLVKISPFISGIISFFVSSILQAEELSITVVPTSANLGAHSRETLPPAEKIAILGFNLTASSMPITSYFEPLYSIFLPIDFSEATGINSSI